MALYVNTNVSSINAQRQLNKTTSILSTTFKRLSSGLRVNSAKDDSASLAIANKMSAQVRGMNQAIRNSNDTISLAQVAEGALDETNNALQRMRELAVQASNGTLTSSDREDISQEMTQLTAEIQRISQDTQYNTQNLLTGSFANKSFQVGANVSQMITFSIAGASVNALGTNSTDVAVSTVATAQQAISAIDMAIGSVSDIRSKLGAIQNRFESVMANLANVSENTQAAASRMVDADIAAETATLTKHAILQQAGTAMLAQANQQPQMALQLLG